MEPSRQPVSTRVSQINAEIMGKNNKVGNSKLSRESLLDALQALYDECNIDNLKKCDRNIELFVEKYKSVMSELKQSRVNATDFEIKNVIGRGHFGEVHVVKEKQTGDVYAMKTIRKFESAEKRKTSYEEERDIMAFTQSPWLTRLHYAFQDSTYLFFIMDYHPGGDLLGLLAKQGGTLPESAATFYLAEVVLALQDLHAMGYVHRDVKPDNILLDRCGHLKLADFGSAARLDKNGTVKEGPPVGTPDYVAPEVLQSLEKKPNSGYGVCCDFWSLGVLAFELTVGTTPFSCQNTPATYTKIMNHSKNLKFPPEITLTQAYISFVKGLVTDQKNRLDLSRILAHSLFKNVNFDTIRDQVPPYVPKVNSDDDTGNFSDVPASKKAPSIENFKRRTQFSGRNLPFIGFTYTPDPETFTYEFKPVQVKDEAVKELKSEVESLRKKLAKNETGEKQREALEKRLEEKSRKLDTVEDLRNQLERDLANNIAECTALKRTLELERKDRADLEKRALDLIKAAKAKWEVAEKNKLDALNLEIEQQREKIAQLTTTNGMLNEQLQHALKQEHRHKESFEKVEDLSRRSVIGLESRIDKITVDNKNTIAELQTKLNDEIHQKMALERQVAKMKEKEASLAVKLKHTEESYSSLKGKVDEAEAVIKELGEKVEILENDTKKLDEFRDEIGTMQRKIDDQLKTIKDLENRNTSLEMEKVKAKELEGQLVDLQKEIKQLRVENRRVSVLEADLQKEKEKNNSLLKQIKESEDGATESNEIRELRSKYWRMEKDFNNCKIDKRILERELKDSQGELKRLQDELTASKSSLEEMKRKHEKALLEISGINESLSMELLKTKETCKNLEDKLNGEKEKFSEEKQLMVELKAVLKTTEANVAQLEHEIHEIRAGKRLLEKQIGDRDVEKSMFLDVIHDLKKDKNEANTSLENAKRELQNTNLNLEALREACTLLESQVIEYEKICKNLEAKQLEGKANTEKLIGELCESKHQTQEAKRLTSEEKSMRLLAETKVKRLQEEMESIQKECDCYKEQCFEYKQYSAGLSDELAAAEEKISDLEVTVKNYQRRLEDYMGENNALKEESSDYLTQVRKARESNCKLNQQIHELKDQNNVLMARIHELDRILNEKTNFYKEREVKTEATIKQQIKLIDYLQTKIDDQQKKKTFTLFGSSKKENQPPISLAMNYKDLEQQLQKERANTKHLQEEVYKLKAELYVKADAGVMDKVIKINRHKSDVVSPRTKRAMEQLVRSPKKGEMQRRNSAQRMRHNIPHRFESKIVTKPTKCAQCDNQLIIGRLMNVCRECAICAHTNCAGQLPKTCGLPDAFMQHYKKCVSETASEGESEDVGETVNVEGWVKIPCKSKGWEKRYACVTDTSIKIYDDAPNSGSSVLLRNVDLKPQDSRGKVVLEPLMSELDVPVAESDLPFIIKVEIAPNASCWPPETVVFMTLSVPEKEKWFKAFQKIFADDLEKEFAVKILEVPKDVTVNTVTDLAGDVRVLGTNKGLYSYHDDSLVRIEGLDEVHSLCLVKSTKTVAMIVNKKNFLISSELSHLINLAQCPPFGKPTLKYRVINIKNLSGFHILQPSEIAGQRMLAVATPKQLIILQYDLDEGEFVPLRILDTAEPTSCILFTEHSLIVGADKFFEIDLSTYGAEEFLDASDAKLKQVFKCYQMKSFPISIILISKNPKEYLISFNEFSVFVDEYGRSSRQYEMTSNSLPFGFRFIKPYLYIVQFSGIEVMKVNEETCNSVKSVKESMEILNVESTRINMEKFQCVGCSKSGIYVAHKSEVKLIEGGKILCSDDSISTEATDNANEDDRFSFTSSVVQSLDGNLSDEGERVVTFAQTSF